MNSEVSDDVAAMIRRFEKTPLIPGLTRGASSLLDRAAIEERLPHRDPFLLLDRIVYLDGAEGKIAARYELERARHVFAGHFPGRPVWPGVLQIEAIAQAGILLGLTRAQGTGGGEIALTHVIGARFIRPIPPGGYVEMQACLIEDGLFATIVGQCLHDGQICSVAAVTGLTE